VKDSTAAAVSQQVSSRRSLPFPAGQDNQLCVRRVGQKLHAGDRTAYWGQTVQAGDAEGMLGTENACWGHKLHAGDRNACWGQQCILGTKMHAGDSLICDRSLSCHASMLTQLSNSRMKVAPPGPGFAQLLCLIFINSQDAASLKASLQQQHTVPPQALKALSGHTPARLLRMHTCVSNTISHVKTAQTCY